MGVALAEMAFSGNVGANVHLKNVPYKALNTSDERRVAPARQSQKPGRARDDYVLFSESNSRFIAEVSPQDQKDFEKHLKGVSFGCIGETEKTKTLAIKGLNNQACVNANIDTLKSAWKKRLAF